MSDFDVSHALGVIARYCSAITNPLQVCNVTQLMCDINNAATRSAEAAPENGTIADIKKAVDDAYAMFGSAGVSAASDLIMQVRTIGNIAAAEAKRLAAA